MGPSTLKYLGSGRPNRSKEKRGPVSQAAQATRQERGKPGKLCLRLLLYLLSIRGEASCPGSVVFYYGTSRKVPRPLQAGWVG
ncbi:hypothetical protein J3F83DRAFT_157787 [Trichoderma novae-zelandiae]